VTWTVESATKLLTDEPLVGRSFANGKKMFSAGLCVACHRFGTEGGGIGPDLSNLAKRSDFKSMIESILDPSLVVSDQYEQHELSMKDGSTVMGRIVTEEDGEYGLVQSGLEPLKLKKVKKTDVRSKAASKLSMMPPALINMMNAEELKDLIAYFVAEGNKRHPMYRSGKKLDIQLISAVYGVAGNAKKQMDVKKQLQGKLNGWEYDVAITNALAGKDPASGVVKVLELSYKLNGKTIRKTIKENETLYFEE
jgi:putative heme-binding domain-containing protein